jgi:hypothetical protein
MDAAFIAECADPSLKPAIVEQFVPLLVRRSAGCHGQSRRRLILVPKPKTPDEAMEIIRQNVGQAVVRVGLTQFPAGVGVKDASELKPDLIEPCENLRMGTKMFSKIMRIVAKWYGNPTSSEVLPQIFEDAVYAWNTGQFEGQSVFRAEDPSTDWKIRDVTRTSENPEHEKVADDVAGEQDKQPAEADTGTAGIRIDLSRINGK